MLVDIFCMYHTYFKSIDDYLLFRNLLWSNVKFYAEEKTIRENVECKVLLNRLIRVQNFTY